MKLEEETGAVSGMVDALRTRLLAELPGFGRHLGYDGKAVPSRSTGRRKAADPDADWGKHETRGVDGKTGKPWTKVKTWFGYGLHVIADVEHEIPVWFEVTRASRSEQPVLSAGLEGLFAAEPALAARCADFCADRGLDGAPLKRKLWETWEVRPLIDVREMWREEKAEPGYDPSRPIRRSLAVDGGGNVLHSEKGEVFCRCPATGGWGRDIHSSGPVGIPKSSLSGCPQVLPSPSASSAVAGCWYTLGLVDMRRNPERTIQGRPMDSSAVSARSHQRRTVPLGSLSGLTA